MKRGFNRIAAHPFVRRQPAVVVFGIALVVFGVFNILPVLREAGHIVRHGQPHTHMRLAAEFLHGRMEFADCFYKDIAVFEGHYYSPFPPFPALFLVPLVLLFGSNWPITVLTPLLGALTAALLFRLLVSLRLSPGVSAWAAFGFLFGTVYWFTIRASIDTCLAHVLGTGMILLALEASVNRRSALWIGVWMGCAFLSRQTLVLFLPFVWLMLIDHDGAPGARRKLLAVLKTVPGLAAALAVYLAYNWVRFHDPLEPGYAFIREPAWYGTRMLKWGVTNLIYLPSNFIRLFLQGFCIEFNDPDRMIPEMSVAGTSLTFASPFLFFALRGRFANRPWLNAAGWGGILLCAVVVLMNKNCMGGWQINGMRYALDFIPALLLFAALGMERLAATPYHAVWKGAVVYSVALNLVAIALTYVPKLCALAGAGAAAP